MEKPAQRPIQPDNEEISLKGLVLKIKEWSSYLLRKWLIIVLAGLIGGALGLLIAIIKKGNYVGELTFVLEDNKSGGLGAYSGLASQFGVDLGGAGGSNGLFSGDNVLEFLKSRLIVERALLTSAKINGKEQTLAEYYIEFNHLREGWKKNQKMSHVSFPVNSDRNVFTLLQDSVLFTIYDAVTKNNLKIVKPEKKSTFISVKVLSGNELFSKIFTECLVKEATDFYVNTKLKRSKMNVDILQAKADSLITLLNRKTYSAAESQDLNLNPVRSMATVKTELVTRDKVVLQTMYAEVVKNLELSRLTMAQETPIIQVVDSPILPLRIEKIGKLKGMISGSFLCGCIVVIVLIIRKIYLEIMQ